MPAKLPRIDAVVVDHYNPFIQASRRPDLLSNKVQFINGVYSVVPPNSGEPAGAQPADTKR